MSTSSPTKTVGGGGGAVGAGATSSSGQSTSTRTPTSDFYRLAESGSSKALTAFGLAGKGGRESRKHRQATHSISKAAHCEPLITLSLTIGEAAETACFHTHTRLTLTRCFTKSSGSSKVYMWRIFASRSKYMCSRKLAIGKSAKRIRKAST